MKQTLHQHFVFLEERLLALRDQVTDPSCTPADLERIEFEIKIAERALSHYRLAVDLERQIRGPAPATDPLAPPSCIRP